MAQEIQFGYTTGRDLSYGVYRGASTVVTAAGTDLPELAGTGYYVASNVSIVPSDFVIVTDSVLGVVGEGQYDVTAWEVEEQVLSVGARISTDLAIIDGIVDGIKLDGDMIPAVYQDTQQILVQTIPTG